MPASEMLPERAVQGRHVSSASEGQDIPGGHEKPSSQVYAHICVRLEHGLPAHSLCDT